MNRYQAPALIAKEFPEADRDLAFLSVTGNINKVMGSLSQYTKKLIVAGQYQVVSQCMALADKIYRKGDAVVKTAVKNVYVYSFSLMSTCCNKVEWRIVKSKIPRTLYSLYAKQMMQSAC